jgi:hypothetical protein
MFHWSEKKILSREGTFQPKVPAARSNPDRYCTALRLAPALLNRVPYTEIVSRQIVVDRGGFARVKQGTLEAPED